MCLATARLILSDVRGLTLTIVCEPCGWRGRYVVERLMAEHGDAKLTDMLPKLANCPKAIAGEKHWLWRAVDQNGFVLDVLVQRRRDTRRAAAHEEAPEIRRHTTARDDHGQAPFVRRCESEDGPSRRTSPVEGPEQSCGEFSSADAATRADHEALQIRWTGATVSVGSRSSVESLPHFPIPKLVTADCRRASRQHAFAVWREISKTGAAA